MDPISRRNALRLVAGTSAAVGGAVVLPGNGLLDTASAATIKKFRAELVDHTVHPGQRIVLEVWRHRMSPESRIRVRDSNGLEWKRVVGSQHPHRWHATAGRHSGTIDINVVGPRGRVMHDWTHHQQLHYQVSSGVMRGPLIGMSAPSGEWDRRVDEVGGGVAARRIYADLAAGAGSMLSVVEQAHNAGMLPVISYKVGGDVAGAVRGDYNAVARRAAALLASFDLPTAVTFWHEPYGDMSGAQYAAASRHLVPIFQRGKLRVGPILNGWLLDRQRSTFASYAPADLLRAWDWVGIDSYESGTQSSPGAIKPADRIPALRAFLRAHGHAAKPLAVGEYNGYSGTTIAEAGDRLLASSNVWFGCMWNSTGNKGRVLTGDRLTAFRRTLADPRSRSPRRTA